MSNGFSVQDIESINKLLNYGKNEEEEAKTTYYNQTGSVLQPNNFNGNNEKKETAKPYYDIEAKFHNRNLTKPENEIWKEKDFKEENYEEDDREKPEFDVLFKQTVGAEDVYFGLSGKDNSSNSCDELSIRIKLPNTTLKEISVEVKQQSIHLNCPKYVLNHILPYSVEKDKSNAKWDKAKCLLTISLPIIKKSIMDCFDEEAMNNK